MVDGNTGRPRPFCGFGVFLLLCVLSAGSLRAQGDNGGYPADVPTNRCGTCGTRYPTKQSDADLYGTVTIFVHTETCGTDPQDPPPADPPPPPADGEDPPVTCASLPCVADPKPTFSTLPPAGTGVVRPADCRLGLELRRRFAEIRGQDPDELLPFVGWTPPKPGEGPVTAVGIAGAGADFWKQAAQ